VTDSPLSSAEPGAAAPPRILYLDEDLVVAHKPSGWLVHPSRLAPDRVTLLSRLRDRLGRRVYPVHRLDRGASGALVLALTREAASFLGAAQRAGGLRKGYEAVVRGWVEPTGRIEKALDGKPALTQWRRLGRAERPWPSGGHPTSRYAWVEVTTGSGRLHQIRRHFAGIAHPLVGDTRYGQGLHNRAFRERLGVHRLLLACTWLELPHPRGGRLRVHAARPPELVRLRGVFALS
jgi:tRNA pseudouridine65 synthase